MLVTVTGASGHLGAHLVRGLLEEGRTVRALVRRDTRALEGLPIERVPGDVLDPATLRRAFDGAEVVYHLAARISLLHGDEPEVRAVNVDGAANVVAACREAGVRRLVHFSSIHAISERPVDGVVDETRPLVDHANVPVYSRTKADGERAVLAAVREGLDAVIVMPTGCIGPLDYKPSAIGQVMLDLHARRVPALVRGGFNWVDVRDVVRSAIAAEKKGRTGERYLLAGTWQPVTETARLIEDITGVRAPRLVAPMWLARAVAPFAESYTRLFRTPVRFSYASLHALRHHRHISDAKARRELGHAPRPVRDSIADSFDWFRYAGMLR